MADRLLIFIMVCAVIALAVGAMPQEKDEPPKAKIEAIVKDKYGEEWLYVEQGDARLAIRYKAITGFYSGKGTQGRDLVYFSGGKMSLNIGKEVISKHFFPDFEETMEK